MRRALRVVGGVAVGRSARWWVTCVSAVAAFAVTWVGCLLAGLDNEIGLSLAGLAATVVTLPLAVVLMSVVDGVAA